jgi:hypothetical protein
MLSSSCGGLLVGAGILLLLGVFTASLFRLAVVGGGNDSVFSTIGVM